MDLNEQAAVAEDLVAGSRKIFFFFGGIAGAIGVPPYEFYRAAKILDHHKVFIRDLDQAWYQRGVRGIGTDPQAVGEYLRQKIRDTGASEVCFVGNSMGGFAALLFCAMLRVGSAIAFAPQTFISEDKRRLHKDRRWSAQISSLHASRAATDIDDLAPWIAQSYREMPAKVYVPASNVLDEAHANELSAFPCIEIHRHPFAGHDLVRHLRDEGALEKILHGAC